MKTVLYIVLTFIAVFFTDSYYGKYSYFDGYYNEQIELKNNHQFVHSVNGHMFKYHAVGNYRINSDSLVLDSYPQRDKLIVRESNNGKKKTTISVTDKQGQLFIYHLDLFLKNGSKITLRDNWDKVSLKEDIKSFYITNTTGLRSPLYIVEGTNVNSFSIQFEQNRTFENEVWEIHDNKITPKGLDGETQNYCLLKSE